MAASRNARQSDSVADEAMRWAVGLEGLSDNRREEFERWLAASDLHRAAFKKACRTWESLACLNQLQDDPAIRRELQAAMQRAKRRRLRRTATLMAASIAVFAIAVAVRWSLPQDYSVSYATAIGEQLTVGLPDDSIVLLNTDTSIAVHYTADGRAIRLERGEAHFEVAHDPSRPFDVMAGNGIVRAVGTAFNVQFVADEEVVVTVTDGVVDILQTPPEQDESATVANLLESDAPSVQRLTEGYNAKITDTVETVSIVDEQVLERKLAWQEGWLRFVNVPLGEVIAEADRYTVKTLVIADAALATHPVTISAKANDIAGLLAVLDDSSDVIEVSDTSSGQIVISAASSL